MTVRATANNRIFFVGSGASLTISRLNLTSGAPSTGHGGAVLVDGSQFDASFAAIWGNRVLTGGNGGAIYGGNGATVSLKNVVVSSNIASTGKGGGIFVEGSDSVLEIYGSNEEYSILQSVIKENNARYGGGIFCDEATCEINRTVVKFNTAFKGAAVYQERVL